MRPYDSSFVGVPEGCPLHLPPPWVQAVAVRGCVRVLHHTAVVCIRSVDTLELVLCLQKML